MQTLPGRFGQVPLDLGGGRDGRAVREPALGRRGTRAAHRTGGHILERRRLALLGGLEVVDLVERVTDYFRDDAAEVVVVELAERGARHREHHVRNARAVQGRDDRAERFAEDLAVVILLRAEAHEQHTAGFHAFQVAHEQGFAGLAREIAARHDLAEPAAGGGIERLGLFGQLAFFEHADNEAIGLERSQSLAPDIELHSCSPDSRRYSRFWALRRGPV